jgi:hypothetical protein
MIIIVRSFFYEQFYSSRLNAVIQRDGTVRWNFINKRIRSPIDAKFSQKINKKSLKDNLKFRHDHSMKMFFY